ncbi:hypothetical protein [Sphingomonas sp. 22176]|uniref:hypothetical protein n=1 Tax=Sphingomonas sp. 22176 TaxID=3453884 RepID=UPI003F834E4F
MPGFSDTEAASSFIDTAPERRTSRELLTVITWFAASLEQAEEIWRTRLLPGRSKSASDEALYETVQRNYFPSTCSLIWSGDAWGARVRGRRSANHWASRWLPRTKIFDAYGLQLFRTRECEYVAEHLSDGAIGSPKPLWTHVSPDQVDLALRGEPAARALLAELGIFRVGPNEAPAKENAVKAVRNQLIDRGLDLSDYAIAAIREVENDCVTGHIISLQRFDAAGQPVGSPEDFNIPFGA